MKHAPLVFALLVALGCQGCVALYSGEPDSWHRPLLPGRAPTLPAALPAYAAREIPAARFSRAELLLRDVALVELELAQAEALTSSRYALDPAKHLVLVRAVRVQPTGNLVAYEDDDSVHVHHTPVIKESLPMTRSAVVVSVDRVPDVVYHLCSFAQ